MLSVALFSPDQRLTSPDGRTTHGRTVLLNCRDAIALVASVAVAVNVNVPAVVGTPASAPVAITLRPGGVSVPLKATVACRSRPSVCRSSTRPRTWPAQRGQHSRSLQIPADVAAYMAWTSSTAEGRDEHLHLVDHAVHRGSHPPTSPPPITSGPVPPPPGTRTGTSLRASRSRTAGRRFRPRFRQCGRTGPVRLRSSRPGPTTGSARRGHDPEGEPVHAGPPCVFASA